MGNLLVAGMETVLGPCPRASTHPDPASPSCHYVLKSWPSPTGHGARVLRLRCHACNHVYTHEEGSR